MLRRPGPILPRCQERADESTAGIYCESEQGFPIIDHNMLPLYGLVGIRAINGCANLRGPFAFWVGRDNALLIPAGLLKIATAYVAEGAPKTRALWLIFGLAIALRGLIPGGHLAVHVSHRFVPAAPEIPLNRTGHGA